MTTPEHPRHLAAESTVDEVFHSVLATTMPRVRTFMELARAYFAQHPGVTHEWRSIPSAIRGDRIDLVCGAGEPTEVFATLYAHQIAVGRTHNRHDDFEDFGRGLSDDDIAREAFDCFVEALDERDSSYTIERLSTPLFPEDLASLARILFEAVTNGAAVSFVQPLTLEHARQWWARTLDAFPDRGVLLGARARGELVGTVQLQPAWAPNQPHRADVAKLLVRRDHQGRGVGAQLMTTLESAARADGFSLLTLDAKAGTPAAQLYVRLGWTIVGTIPDFARDPDGPLHDAVVMYKALGS